ncbi:MAG: SDR family NAD(P)-dependent oxidoreductase [Lentisphaeria bacterium]|nr:SDR family NAD(P)-dependent oxidoreductase [Lentisphaeria bacterium]
MTTAESLEKLAALSRQYGADPDYVFLGGGNTSFKTDSELFIKPSGVALATIQPEQFLKLDRESLRKIFTMAPAMLAELREEFVKNIQLSAVRPLGAGRPSVEAPVHEVIKYKFIVHTHPALVNGLTCSKDGKAAAAKLFPKAIWLDYCNPGCTLSFTVKEALDAAEAKNGAQPNVIFLQKHGVFIGADTADEVAKIYADVMDALKTAYQTAGISTDDVEMGTASDEDLAEVAPALRTLLADEDGNRAIVHCVGNSAAFEGPLTPDHVVYAKSFAFRGEATAEAIAAFKAQRGYLPKVVEIPGKALFTVSQTLNEARSAAIALANARKIEKLTAAFGGVNYLTEEQYSFIENWEVESYRRSVNGGASKTRLQNRVCVVTGGAQGFGLGIAQDLIAEGGTMVLADMNFEGANKAAEELNAKYGKGRAFAVAVNVADEDSVAAMMAAIVREVGGIDLFVNNAGVVRSGSVMELSLKDFTFVTNINYLGYFLCCKYAAKVMSKQMTAKDSPWTDIVQVNSKSGLEGSNKNGAYAGSKFGGIGLTQSFAKELVTSHIKVNSVCPGNYLDGPLWSDPVRGLFVQYLNAGKVPGATCVEDVREFYMSKVPMHRGCLPTDVARAILYCVEQKYETGQAIPVTGGQNMLHA